MATLASISLSFISSAAATAASQTPVSDYVPVHVGDVNKDGIPSGKQGEHVDNFLEAQAFSIKNPGTNLKGANDFNCKPKPSQLPLILFSSALDDENTSTRSTYQIALHALRSVHPIANVKCEFVPPVFS